MRTTSHAGCAAALALAGLLLAAAPARAQAPADSGRTELPGARELLAPPPPGMGPGLTAAAAAAPGDSARREPPSTARPFGVPGQPAPRLAIVPLENLSARAEMGEFVTRILYAEVVGTGLFELDEQGVVNPVLEDLRIRPTGTLSRAELRGLRDSLGAEYVMLGTVLESGEVRTWDGEVPAVALVLRLLDATTGRVVWADFGARSGDDKETVFGWGRERYGDKLAGDVIRGMLKGLHFPAPQAAQAAPKGAKR